LPPPESSLSDGVISFACPFANSPDVVRTAGRTKVFQLLEVFNTTWPLAT